METPNSPLGHSTGVVKTTLLVFGMGLSWIIYVHQLFSLCRVSKIGHAEYDIKLFIGIPKADSDIPQCIV